MLSVSADKHGTIVGKDKSANLLMALESAEMEWANVVQFTTYLVDSRDIPKFMLLSRSPYSRKANRTNATVVFAQGGAGRYSHRLAETAQRGDGG
jgi:hypothetical protein